MRKLTEPELQKLHNINIAMAEVFYQFCKDNKLTCYLCGGGCIGAIRHGGMIPWDDDLDFFMPREDYEKAIMLWRSQMKDSPYKLMDESSETRTHDLFFKIRDSRTTWIAAYQSDLDIVHGVPLDVLPLDGYPDGRIKRKIQVFWALIYSLFRAQTVPQKHGGMMAFGSKMLLSMVPWQEARVKIWGFAKRQMTKYPISKCSGITELCSGPGYMKNWYPKEAFEYALEKPFEDTFLPIPCGYDAYLRIAFGNYMELPPEEKRVAHHDAEYVDLEHSYKQHKGEFYCR